MSGVALHLHMRRKLGLCEHTERCLQRSVSSLSVVGHQGVPGAPLDADTSCGDLEVKAWSLLPSNPARGAGMAISPFNTWLDLL